MVKTLPYMEVRGIKKGGYSEKRFALLLIVLITFFIILMAFFSFFQEEKEGNIKDKNNFVIENGYIPIYEDENSIFINQTLLEKYNDRYDGNNTFFYVKKMDEISSFQANNISEKFLNNPILDEKKGNIWYYNDAVNKNLRIVIRSNGKVSYINESNDLIYSKESYNISELVRYSNIFMEKIGRNLTGFKVDLVHQNNLTRIEYDNTSDNYNTTFIGYTSNIIMFRQYVNGLPVYGDSGYVEFQYFTKFLPDMMDFRIQAQSSPPVI